MARFPRRGVIAVFPGNLAVGHVLSTHQISGMSRCIMSRRVACWSGDWPGGRSRSSPHRRRAQQASRSFEGWGVFFRNRALGEAEAPRRGSSPSGRPSLTRAGGARASWGECFWDAEGDFGMGGEAACDPSPMAGRRPAPRPAPRPDGLLWAQRLAARSRATEYGRFLHWAKVAAEVARIETSAEMDIDVVKSIVDRELRHRGSSFGS